MRSRIIKLTIVTIGILIVAVFYFRSKGPVESRVVPPIRVSMEEIKRRRWVLNNEAVTKKIVEAPSEKIELKESVCKQTFKEVAELGSETFDKQFIEGETDLSNECLNQIRDAGFKEDPEQIRKACKENRSKECATGLVNLKTKAIYEATKGANAAELSEQTLLSKIYALSNVENSTETNLRELYFSINALEARNPDFGLGTLKALVLEELTSKDPRYHDLLEYETNEMAKILPKEALNIRFKHLLFAKDYDALESVLNEYMQMHPEDSEVHYYFAILEFKRSNIEKSKALMAKAAQLSPNNAFYQNQLHSLEKDPGSWKPSFSMPTVTFEFSG